MVCLCWNTVIVVLIGCFLSAIVYVLMHPVPPVLMFHSVMEYPVISPYVSPSGFRAFVTSIQPQAEHVQITTDSSDARVYSDFFPVLREHGLTATIFLLPLEIGQADNLTWTQIREMEQAGFAIGSHTLTHPWLPDLTDEEIVCELCGSKALIERELRHPITALAYPYGAFNRRVQKLAEQCGYTRAYSTAPGRRVSDHDGLALKRVYVNETVVQSRVLTRLAVSGFYVTIRELALSWLPIDLPRHPEGWSPDAWRASAKRRLSSQ